jgi:hypothetical protein
MLLQASLIHSIKRACPVEFSAVNDMERRKRAMGSIEEAVRILVKEAARLTAEGVDTSGLAEPIMKMQEAMGELGDLDCRANRIRGTVDPRTPN